jgi:transcriptional regulator with XRE-family HTH domain
MAVGSVIKKIRKNKGFSQGEFAEACGVTQAYLSQIESGKRRPGQELVNKAGEILKIPPQVITFLSLDAEDIEEGKREAFDQIAPSINAMIERFFLGN